MRPVHRPGSSLPSVPASFRVLASPVPRVRGSRVLPQHQVHGVVDRPHAVLWALPGEEPEYRVGRVVAPLECEVGRVLVLTVEEPRQLLSVRFRVRRHTDPPRAPVVLVDER